MKKTNINLLTAAAAIALCMMTGCADTSDSGNTANVNAKSSVSASAETGTLSEDQAASASASEDLFSKRDLEQTADTSDAKTIEVKDGETIDITEEGVYTISGSAKNCTIRIKIYTRS